jgi:flagellar biosynthesis repressor protein FlbT
MGVMIDLRPGEQLLLGQGFIVNNGHRTRLYIEGSFPILREKEAISEGEANTPAKRVYLALQQMYLATDPTYSERDFSKAREFAAGNADLLGCIDAMGPSIGTREIYKAMRNVRSLMQSESR